MLLAHRITKEHFQKIQHYEKKKRDSLKVKWLERWNCNAALKKKSLGKNDFNMKYVLRGKQCSGGTWESRASSQKAVERNQRGRPRWREVPAQAAAELLAGKSFSGPSRFGHKGMLLLEAFLRSSAPFPVFRTRAKESGELCRQITTRSSAVC